MLLRRHGGKELNVWPVLITSMAPLMTKGKGRTGHFSGLQSKGQSMLHSVIVEHCCIIDHSRMLWISVI
jgi:hypothetical protein